MADQGFNMKHDIIGDDAESFLLNLETMDKT